MKKCPFLFSLSLLKVGTSYYWWIRVWHGQKEQMIIIIPAHGKNHMAIHEQLEKLGYKPEDIDIVVFTHLHWDHMFYVEKFKNATLIAHEREWEFANNPIPLYYKSYEHPALGITRPFEGLNLQQLAEKQKLCQVLEF